MEKTIETHAFTVVVGEDKQRLDRYLVGKFPQLSRSYLGKLIHSGKVVVNDNIVKAGFILHPDHHVTVHFPPPQKPELKAEPIDFPIIYEDGDVLVLVKPPGLVVHPAAGHHQGTLVNGLLYHCNTLSATGSVRPGIVHRLDKDTSGIMLVAKNDSAMLQLCADFKERNVRKIYHSLLTRAPYEQSGRIVAPIGRHPVQRKKMAIRQVNGKYAATCWEVLENFSCGCCFAELEIETGRTHQIRVHMASLQSPVAGDSLYGGKNLSNSPVNAHRQLLHASTLFFRHPVTRKKMDFTAPLWPDFQSCLDVLRGNT